MLLCLIFVGVACDGGENGPTLSEGDFAPGFSLPSVSGNDVALSDFNGDKSALLYFSMGPG